MPFWSGARINDTFAFIVSKVPGGEKNIVMAFLRRWLTETYGAAANLLSDRMSVAGGRRALPEDVRDATEAGDKQTRAARRALVILRHEMLNPGQPARLQQDQIMSMASGQVTTSLNALLPGFRLYAMQEQGVTTDLQLKLFSLKGNPLGFLQNNLVITQSARSPNDDGVGQTESYRFIFNYREQAFLLIPSGALKPNGVRGNGITLNVVNVPEWYWFRVPGRGRNPAPGNFGQLPCTELTGADLMVTSAFTGCSFCFKSNAGRVYAAHISPDGTAANAGPNIGAAPELATQLIATGDFAAPAGAVAGALQVFGRGRSNLGAYPNGYAVNAVPGVPLVQASMYVIGSQGGGGHNWTLVFQENNAGARNVGRLI
jgi:hypothetical protein